MENIKNNSNFLPLNDEDIENNNQELETCRFCLDNDKQEDMFKPCLCNSKVHRSCLSQWRLLHSPNDDNFLKCEICNYNYNILNKNNNNCFKCCNFINKNRFVFSIFLFFIINFTLTFIFNFFKNINTNYFIKVSHEKDVRDYILSVIILLSLSLFILIINDIIFFCKNKKNTPEYIKEYYNKFGGVGLFTFIIFLGVNFLSYLVMPIMGICITTMIINVISLHIFQIYINRNNINLYEVLEFNSQNI